MSKIPKSQWTEDEKEFDRAVRMNESRLQMDRIDGRLKLKKLTEKHGKDKMDAMWERIK